jgi:hypothetical protein
VHPKDPTKKQFWCGRCFNGTEIPGHWSTHPTTDRLGKEEWQKRKAAVAPVSAHVAASDSPPTSTPLSQTASSTSTSTSPADNGPTHHATYASVVASVQRDFRYDGRFSTIERLSCSHFG